MENLAQLFNTFQKFVQFFQETEITRTQLLFFLFISCLVFALAARAFAFWVLGIGGLTRRLKRIENQNLELRLIIEELKETKFRN